MFVTNMPNNAKSNDPIFVEEARLLKELFIARQEKLKENKVKLSQKVIADDAGWSQTNVANYLNGYTSLNANAASIFAKHLNCSILEFSPRLYWQIKTQASSSDAPVNNSMRFKKINVYDSNNLDKVFGFDAEGSAMAVPIKIEIMTDDLPDGVVGFVQPDNSLGAEQNGEVFLVDPNMQAAPGQLVLVRIRSSEYELRRIKILELDDNSEPLVYELSPENTDYAKRTVNTATSTIKLCGVAIKHIRNLI